MAETPSPRQVRSGEVTLAVRERSPRGPGRPTVVLVHGYPDRQETWDPLVAELPLDAWHVVTYDVRGAGASSAPASRDGYRTERLVDDLVAVLDAVLDDGEAAHLVGHDWGSVQLWDAVAAEATDPRLRGRLASFTSVSGPSLDHVAWLLRHPDGRRAALARQGLRSTYTVFFRLPVLPEAAWWLGGGPLRGPLERAAGLPPGHWGAGLRRDAVDGLELYRANLGARPRGRDPLRTSVPVLVVQPEADPFVGPVFLEGLDEVGDVTVERVRGGHWVVARRPERVAPLVVRHVEAHRRDGR